MIERDDAFLHLIGVYVGFNANDWQFVQLKILSCLIGTPTLEAVGRLLLNLEWYCRNQFM